MKRNILIVMMMFVAAVMWGQTYSTCTINSENSNRKTATGSSRADIYDGDWGSYWRSKIEENYKGDWMELYLKNPQQVDQIVVKRGSFSNGYKEVYPGFTVNYRVAKDNSTANINIGSFARNEKTTKTFNVNNTISTIRLQTTDDIDGSWRSTYCYHEVEARRFHRLALTLKQDAGLEATHNGTAAPITILSTQAKVHYNTEITGVNRKLEGWYWNGTLVNQGNYFDYTHTVNTIDGTGTMYAKAVDCIPTFERENLSLPIGLGQYTNPLTTDENDKAVKTFTSSNTDVATVDNTGKLTLKTVGTTTITMTQPNWGVYGPMKASYTLSVDNIGVLVTGGVHAGYYGLDELPASIQGATKITTLGENWIDNNIAKLKAAMAGSKATLLEMDMETLTFSGNIYNGMHSLLKDYSVLKKVTLPKRVQTVAINLNSAFASCAALTDIVNMPNLHNVNDLTGTFSGCTMLTNVSFLLSGNATNNNIMMLYSTFANCKALTNVDLTSYRNIFALHSAFTQCIALKTVTFSTAANNNSVTMCQTFAGCSALEYVNNLDSFKKASDFRSTFNNCSSLKEIRLGVEPSTINFSNLSGTFTSANNTYLKYLPSCTSVVPTAWHMYKNFVVALTSISDIPTVFNGNKDQAFALPTAPVINPVYAANRDARWEIFNGTKWVEWQNNIVMREGDDGREVRYAARSLCDDTWFYSNTGKLFLLGKYIVVTGGANEGKYFADNLPTTAWTGATKVQVFGGEWTDAEFGKIKTLMAGSKATLTEFDFSQCTITGDMTTSFKAICQNFTALKTVKFFGAYTPAAFDLEGAFEGCINLTTVSNINNIHQITCLRSTFANCAKLVRVEFRDQDSGHELYMYRAFYGCSSLEAVVNIDNFSWIKNLEMAFEGCSSLTRLDFRNEEEETKISMKRAFFGCKKLTTINYFGKFTEINNMESTFEGCEALTSIDLRDKFIFGSIGDNDNTMSFKRTFYGCKNLTSVTHLTHYSKISNLTSTFEGCTKLKSITFNDGEWENANVSLSRTFKDCVSLTSISNLTGLRSYITSLESAFDGCVALTSIEFYDSKNPNVVNMNNAFRNCKKLTSITNLEYISNISDLTSAFEGCEAIDTIKLSSTTSSRAVSAASAFKGCLKLRKINDFEKLTNITNLNATFENCNSLSVSKIGVNPTKLTTANLVDTYTGALNKNLYLKYLGVGTKDIPQQWKDQGYVNFVLPITITIPEQEDVKIGKALNLPVDPVLPTYAARRDEEYQVKKAGASTWVEFNPATLMDASYSDAELRYVARSYLNDGVVSSNIVIIKLKKPSLFVDNTVDIDSEVKYDTVQINAGGLLNVNADITADVLILKCSKTDRYEVSENAGSSISAKRIEVHVSTDGATWTWFSTPFDFTMTKVINDNKNEQGAYNTGWQIKEYDQADRAVNGFYSPNSWKVVANSENLKALHGYIVSNCAPVDAPTDVKFIEDFGDAYTEISLPNTVDVEFTEDPSPNDVGWNLISAPCLKDSHFTLSSNDSNNIVVNIPINYGASGYTQLLSTEHVFKPSESFFVQVASAGKLTFTPLATPSAAPALKQQSKQSAYNIFITDIAGNEDRASLSFRADAPADEYYIEYDVEKMTVYTDKPRVYFPDHNLKLAFSCLNPAHYSEIELGVYIPKAGDYTLDFSNIEGVMVYDRLLDVEIYSTTYDFRSDVSGHITDRFYISERREIVTENNSISEGNDYEVFISQDGSISIDNLGSVSNIQLFGANGILLVNEVVSQDKYTINDMAAGVYMLFVNGNTRKIVVK